MIPGLVARSTGLVRRQFLGQDFRPAEGVTPQTLFAELARYSRELVAPQDLQKLARRYGHNPWIFAACFRKAQDQAAIPLEVVQWTGDTGTPVGDEHPLQELLYRVNPFLTGEDLIELDSLYLDLTGNDFWLIFGARDGQPAEIWPLMPHWVSVVKDPERFIAGYVVRPDGGDPHPFFPIASSPTGTGILHLKRANPWDLWWGQGPLAAAWAAALTDEAAAEYRYWFYKNAARPDGILKTAQKLTDGSLKQIRESWAATFQGPANAHRVAVLDSDLTYQPISVSPKDADVHKDRELSRPDQLVAFGVPLAALGVETGDIGRRDEQIRHYYRSTILPCVKKRCGTLTEFLAPAFGPGLEIRPDLSQVKELQEDEQRRVTVDQILLQTGQRTINEVRERDGLAPVPWGDKPLVPISLAPLGEGGFGFTGLSGGGLGAHKVWPGMEFEDLRGRLWEELVEKAGSYERDFSRLVLGALLEANQGVVRALHAGVTPATAVTEGLAGLPAALYAAALAVLPEVLDAAWLRALALIRRARRETRGMKQAELEIAFDLAIPEIAAYLRQRPVRYGDQVAATLSEWFRGTLGELANEGASIDQMAQAISSRFAELAPARARLIARVEVGSASNLSMTTAYERSEVVEAREWLTAMDERVRPTHQVADGQVRALGEAFQVGGAALQYPGDPQGPAGEIINCRCVTLPILTEE